MEAKKLYLHIKDKIINKIKNNNYKKLPPENELAKTLGVSVSTLREALLVLKNEGVLDKKHGIGSFVHESALKARMRIDLISEFKSLIEDGGYEVGIEQQNHWKERAGPQEIENLELDQGEEILVYERVFTADNKPAILALNKMPLKLLAKYPTKEDLERPIYRFIWEYCEEKLSQSILEFVPCSAREKESELFAVEPGTPLISWLEIFFTITDTPISFNQIKFNPDIMKLKILRKW